MEIFQTKYKNMNEVVQTLFEEIKKTEMYNLLMRETIRNSPEDINAFKSKGFKIFTLLLNGDFVKKYWFIKEADGTIRGPLNGFEMDILNLTNSFKENTQVGLKGNSFLPLIMFTLMSNFVVKQCYDFTEDLIKKKHIKPDFKS